MVAQKNQKKNFSYFKLKEFKKLIFLMILFKIILTTIQYIYKYINKLGYDINLNIVLIVIRYTTYYNI